jgi:hypothetical protein
MFRKSQIDRQIAQPWLAVSSSERPMTLLLIAVASRSISVWDYTPVLLLGYSTGT